MNEFSIIVSTIAIVLSTVSIILGTISVALITGLKNSTHSIQYVPIDEIPVEENEEEQPIKKTNRKKDPDIEDLYQHI